MNSTVEIFNQLLATGGILLFLFSSILLIDLLTSRVAARIIGAWGILIGFLVTTSSSIVTLIYSDVFGFVPCGLCWFQRIFLYPQVLLLGLAIFYKEKTAARYGLALSIPGLVFALYNHYLQMGGTQFIACPASGIDCTKRYMFEYGFMTFPLLSAILFIFLIILYIYILKTEAA